MLKMSQSRSRGFTLVELMVGLVVAMVILLGASKMYINTSESSKNALRATRLNQDMRAVMDLMVSDIRRAGYWGQAVEGQCNPFTNRTGTQTFTTYCASTVTTITDIFVSTGCILYSYDYDKNGTINANTSGTGNGDFFGFRINNGAVQMLNPHPSTSFSDTSSACTNATWLDLTDPAAITVTGLSFSTVDSQCINVTAGVSWSAPAGSMSSACLETTATGYAAPASTDNLLETRTITITLSAQHAQDPFLARTLSETVQVRASRAIVNSI